MMTAEKRKANEKDFAEDKVRLNYVLRGLRFQSTLENVLKNSGFISLNKTKGTVKTYNKEEGSRLFNYGSGAVCITSFNFF